LLSLIVMVGVSIITFILTRVVPSEPAARWVGPHATAEQIAKARVELGLDKPLYIQYWRYIRDFIKGDWGTSILTHQPVLRDLAKYLPASVELILFSTMFGFILGIPIGILSAARDGTPIDHAGRLLSVSGLALPTFWLGMILQLVFFKELRLLPLSGRTNMILSLTSPIRHITGFYLIDSLITGNFTAFADALKHIILPGITLAAYPLGLAVRMTRATMLEVLSEDYIRTAKACGVREVKVLTVYALRNAIAPVLSVAALNFGSSLVATFMVESVFNWPGLGYYGSKGIMINDYPAIMSITLLIAFTFVLLNLIVDIVQAFLDPRIRIS